ncbi:helix-turn-helix domain-containing protein [Winogradskyella alexanderae]|uniref:AraC family transcriptional regulator n=1 Tax=Winogradskyella alexanderae TaxID=2877123 RepID=A0ABS7XUP1_9FLAO|nr:AraC family transcriptional regulator [Winogradskyella alexanderae]MCA0132741.1 AraC family transcriptional regulator [Winogradskyella alexanderae]
MTIMVIEISDFMTRVEAVQYTIFTQKFHSSVAKTLGKYRGHIQSNDNNNYVVTFNSVTDAVQCALDIQYKFKYVTPKHKSFSRKLNLALVYTDKFNEKAVDTCKRLCETVKDQLVITSQLKALYEKVNEHAEIDKSLIRTLKPKEEEFLINFMDFLEINWHDAQLNIGKITQSLGLTYGQLYWRLHKLTGYTPQRFIKDFRLHKGMLLLHNQRGNISQVAKNAGFKSATHFSDSFLETYGIRPSKYVQQHAL